MKKALSLLLALVLVLSMTACGNGAKTAEQAENETEEMPEITETAEITEITEEASSDTAYLFDGAITGDVTVEEVVVRPYIVTERGHFFDWEMKVRNTSGEDTKPGEFVIRVWFRYLDENGDILDDAFGEAGTYSPVRAEQAAWVQINGRPSELSESEMEKVSFIEIYGYTKTPYKSPEYFYENPIVIDIREFLTE